MMQWLYDGIYRYTGYRGYDAQCHLRIVTAPGRTAVLATGSIDPADTSVSTKADHLASHVWQAFDLPLEGTLWSERYPDRNAELRPDQDLERGPFTLFCEGIADNASEESPYRVDPRRSYIVATTCQPVNFCYRQQELVTLFDMAKQHAVEQGGRYDVSVGTIVVWPQVESKPGNLQQTSPVGAFNAYWSDQPYIHSIEADTGWSVDDMLGELAVLERQAFGCVKYGRTV